MLSISHLSTNANHINAVRPCTSVPKIPFFLGSHGIIINHSTFSLSEIALPQHSLQILNLFRLECLYYELAKQIVITSYQNRTNLDINMPSILPRLLEITDNALGTLTHDACITRSLCRQCRQYTRYPLRWRTGVRKCLN